MLYAVVLWTDAEGCTEEVKLIAENAKALVGYLNDESTAYGTKYAVTFIADNFGDTVILPEDFSY